MNANDLSSITIVVPVRAESPLTRRLSSYYRNTTVNLAVHPRPELNADEVVRLGLDVVRTPFAAILGDDDLLLPSFISKAIEFLAAHSRHAACHGRGFVMDLHTGACGPYNTVSPAQRHQFSVWRTEELRAVYAAARRAAPAFWDSKACPHFGSRELLLSWIADTWPIHTLKEYAIVRGSHSGRNDGAVVIDHAQLIEALNNAGLDGKELWDRYRKGRSTPVPIWWPLKSPQRLWSPLHGAWRAWRYNPKA
jgi:hypothetical protein